MGIYFMLCITTKNDHELYSYVSLAHNNNSTSLTVGPDKPGGPLFPGGPTNPFGPLGPVSPSFPSVPFDPYISSTT